ncbi:hypothetical protein AX15_007319 [Amanita polypyramis BW_CC]|nr:hypothetical protein AX15_007319 [Amanita polypyramis BW_CC]
MKGLRPCNFIFLFIAVTIDSQASSATKLSNDKGMHHAREREPRQLGVGVGTLQPAPTLSATSTFNYWWPYPAWTATAATGSSVAAEVAATVPPVPTSSAAAIPTSQDSIELSSSSPSFLLSPSGDSSTTSSWITPTSVVPSSISASQSTASIDSHNRTNNPILSSHILLPVLIATLGTIAGAVLIWFICVRCHCRGRRRSQKRYSHHRSSGKGWRVVQGEMADGEGKRGWWDRLLGRRAEVDDIIPGPRYVGIDDLESGKIEPWTGKESVLKWHADVERLAPRYAYEDWDRVPDEEQAVALVGDGDPFLLRVPSKAKGASTKSSSPPHKAHSSYIARPPVQSHSTMSGLLEMYDSDWEDEVEDTDEDKSGKNKQQIPWESLRHKSIKRSILAKVDEEKKWSDSVRSLRAAKARAALANLMPKSEDGTDVGVDRSRTISIGENYSQRKGEDRDGEGGFRIDVESPPPQIPTPDEGKAWSLASSLPFPLFSHEQADRVRDPYTPVPMRARSGSKSGSGSRRKSRESPYAFAHAGSPIKSQSQGRDQQVQKRQIKQDIDTNSCKPSPSVLRMRSPPSVMTPQMESALCFTPVIGAVDTGGGESCGYGGVREAKRQSGRKLRRSRASKNDGPLPFPRDPNANINSPRPDVYRGRLVKPVKGWRDSVGTDPTMDRNGNKKTMDSLAEPEPDTIYTKTYRDRTDRAIKRVEAIIDSGWNERGRVRDR